MDRRRPRDRPAVTQTSPMTLERDTVLTGIREELTRFGALVASLSDDDLRAPTRCADWTVAHVAGHVIGIVVDVSQGRVEGQGTPEVTGAQARARSERTAGELAAQLSAATDPLLDLLGSLPMAAWDGPAPDDPSYTLAFAVEAIWYDAYLHGDDIRHALGRKSERGASVIAAVHHVAGYLERQGVGMTLELDGVDRIAVCTGGSVVRGDPLAFVLAVTGRADPAELGLDPSINVYRN